MPGMSGILLQKVYLNALPFRAGAKNSAEYEMP